VRLFVSRHLKTGRPLPPSVSGGLTSPVSTPILLGARLEPKPSANVSTARNSGGASPIPSSSSSSSSSSRGGDEAMEASRRTTGWVGKGGKVPQQRIGKRAEVPEQPNGTAPPQAPHHYRSACPDEEAKQKVAAQAAKMAERRKRCVLVIERCQMAQHAVASFPTSSTTACVVPLVDYIFLLGSSAPIVSSASVACA